MLSTSSINQQPVTGSVLQKKEGIKSYPLLININKVSDTPSRTKNESPRWVKPGLSFCASLKKGGNISHSAVRLICNKVTSLLVRPSPMQKEIQTLLTETTETAKLFEFLNHQSKRMDVSYKKVNVKPGIPMEDKFNFQKEYFKAKLQNIPRDKLVLLCSQINKQRVINYLEEIETLIGLLNEKGKGYSNQKAACHDYITLHKALADVTADLLNRSDE